MTRALAPSPVPVRVAAHPYLPGRFTHVVAQGDALARGWLFFCDVPFGVWRTREAAARAARRLQARGLVSVRAVRA